MKQKKDHAPSATPVPGQPDEATEQINKFGTYNVQPTADTENLFPAIAHGLPDREAIRKEQGKK